MHLRQSHINYAGFCTSSICILHNCQKYTYLHSKHARRNKRTHTHHHIACLLNVIHGFCFVFYSCNHNIEVALGEHAPYIFTK